MLSGSIQDPGGYMRLLKYGLNTWTVNAAQTYAGDTYLMGGTMTLNFAAAGAPTTNILYNGLATPGRITMESANLYLQGAAGASNTQNIYKLGFGPGSQITVAPGAGGTMTLNCTANSANGSWQRNPDGNNPGGSLNITIGNGGAVYAGTGGGNQAGLVNNLLTNYGGNVAAITYSGTVGTGATDWASENTANNAVVALGAAGSGGSYSNDDYSAATNNVNITSSTPAPVSPFTVSTLAFRTNQAYNMTLPAGTSSLSARRHPGGEPSRRQNNVTFSGPGNITGGTGNEVILHQYNTGTVTFGSGTIANNGATAVQFTKAGPGTTILLGTQTYTGSTNVSAGTLQLGTGLTGGNTTLSSPTVYISAGGRLVYDNADNQTITTQWTTDGYAQSGNNLDIVQKLGAGTLYLTPAAANSGRVGIEFWGALSA